MIMSNNKHLRISIPSPGGISFDTFWIIRTIQEQRKQDLFGCETFVVSLLLDVAIITYVLPISDSFMAFLSQGMFLYYALSLALRPLFEHFDSSSSPSQSPTSVTQGVSAVDPVLPFRLAPPTPSTSSLPPPVITLDPPSSGNNSSLGSTSTAISHSEPGSSSFSPTSTSPTTVTEESENHPRQEAYAAPPSLRLFLSCPGTPTFVHQQTFESTTRVQLNEMQVSTSSSSILRARSATMSAAIAATARASPEVYPLTPALVSLKKMQTAVGTRFGDIVKGSGLLK